MCFQALMIIVQDSSHSFFLYVCFSVFHPTSWVIQDMRFLSLTYMISTAKYFLK